MSWDQLPLGVACSVPGSVYVFAKIRENHHLPGKGWVMILGTESIAYITELVDDPFTRTDYVEVID